MHANSKLNVTPKAGLTHKSDSRADADKGRCNDEPMNGSVRNVGAGREDPDADFKIQKVYSNKKKAQGKNRGRG